MIWLSSSTFPKVTRSFVLNLIALNCLVGNAGAEESASAVLSAEALTARITSGIELLNQTYWSPALQIWLDRPGDDLRAHYEGRLNPPWWPSANALEVLLDFMNA